MLHLLALLWIAAPLHAHDGEDHSHDTPPPIQSASPRVEAHSPDIELLGILQHQELTLYLDRYADNVPLPDATVELESGTHKAVAKHAGGGVYRIAADWLHAPGRHELVFTIQAGELNDLLAATLTVTAPPPLTHANRFGWRSIAGGIFALIGAFALALFLKRRRSAPLLLALAFVPLQIGHAPPGLAHGGEDHSTGSSPAVASDAPHRLPDGSVFVPKTAQRAWGIRTEIAEVGERPYSVELNGHVVADPTFSGRVQSSQPGRIEPGSKGVPHLGQRVAKGEVLAWLTPVSGSLERGGSQAQLAEINTQSELAERRMARLAQLEDIVPQKEMDRVRAELRGLAERKAALSGALNRKEALRAPVGGVISAVNVAVGQVVEAREILFEIINPEKLWVEAIAYDPALPAQIATASAVGADGQKFGLTYLGSGGQLREHALPLQFRALPPLPTLNVAQPVRVVVETRRRQRAVAVPQAAIVKNTGSDTFVWLHVSAERFAPRRVYTQALDAARVALPEGVQAGERVVTVGAALLNQVR